MKYRFTIDVEAAGDLTKEEFLEARQKAVRQIKEPMTGHSGVDFKLEAVEDIMGGMFESKKKLNVKLVSDPWKLSEEVSG